MFDSEKVESQARSDPRLSHAGFGLPPDFGGHYYDRGASPVQVPVIRLDLVQGPAAASAGDIRDPSPETPPTGGVSSFRRPARLRWEPYKEGANAVVFLGRKRWRYRLPLKE
jgi:hypothetical protein